MTDSIQQHERALLAAFSEVIRAEEEIALAKRAVEEAQAAYAAQARAADERLRGAWATIAGLMDESGEVAVVLPGAVTDYEIYRPARRDSVKVVDPAAVPEAFVRLERRPKLKEIGDYLRTQARAGLPLPNWAALELGEARLAWRAKKKHATE